MGATVCEKCGDRGYYEALTFCTKCHISAEHRYCLDELPDKLDEEVVDWMCEDCAPRISEESPLSEPISVPARTSDRLRLKKNLEASHGKTRLRDKNNVFGSVTKAMVQRRIHFSAQAAKCRTRLKKKKSKPSLVTKAKAKSSEQSPSHQPCIAPCTNIHEKVETLGKDGQLIPDDAGNFNEEAEFVETNASQMTTDEPSSMLEVICFENEQPMVNTNCSENDEQCQKIGEQRNLVHDDQGNTREEAEPAIVMVSGFVNTNFSENDEQCQKIGEQRNLVHDDQGNTREEAEPAIVMVSGFVTSNMLELDPSNVPELSCFVRAQPVIDPIWRGSFSICNENFDSVNGLAAHLSSKACLKVCQQANMLPASLSSKLLPKSDVWPKSFHISKPTDDNIALYFFPESERDEKAFDSLVLDMVSHELALKTVVENAELLVFASTELPLRNWRFNGKLYLWGVFRGKQVSSSPSSSNLAAKDAEIKDASMVTTTWNSRSPLSPLSNNGSHSSELL